MQWLRTEIQKGLDSGPAEPLTDQFWHDLRDCLHQRDSALTRVASCILRSPQAATDIANIAEYLRREAGLQVALHFVASVETAFSTIAHMPRIGALLGFHDEIFRDIRRWHIDGFPNHLVLYRPADSGVAVVRVLHTARDIDALFGRPS